MNKLKNLTKRLAQGAVSAGAIVAGAAHAALPTNVSDAITAYETDALAAIGLVMAAGVAIWGLRKLAGKMGWM
jgi:hypothetical protein